VRFRAVLLDVDGTLVDTTFVHALCWQEAFRVYGHTVPSTQLHRAIGMGSERVLDHILGKDRDRSDDDKITEAHKVLYRQHWDRVALLPGAVDLLRACKKAGCTVVLASSAKADDIEHYLDVLDARELADDGTSSADVEETKPAPDLVQVALEKAETEDAVMVGDTPWDVEAAEKAGVPTVAVLTGGFSEQELRDAGAEAIELNNSVRVVAQTALRDAPNGGVVVDGEVITAPYVIEAIGGPHNLASALDLRRGFTYEVERVGGEVGVARSDSVEIASVHEAPQSQYADPVPTE